MPYSNLTDKETTVETKTVDVAIIGAGSAGLYALGQVRRARRSFVLINGGEPGTTCARVGCMPSKAMIQSAEDYHTCREPRKYGITGHEGIGLDLGATMEHVRHLRDIFVDRVLSHSTDEMGEEFIQDYARFLEPTLLQVGDLRIRAGSVVIATGSRPLLPGPWQAFGEHILTTDDFFEQDELPATMAVIGLGTIGLELGQSLARLGVEVTGFDQLETISGVQDPEVRRHAIEIMQKSLPMHLGQPAEIEAAGHRLQVSAGEHSVTVDKVLCSIGRVPNVRDLGLENLGVALDNNGMPPVNPNTMQVADLPVFLAGDVTGERMILHEAGDEGRIAGYNAARDGVSAFRRKTPLAINFCDPNICTVGARWNELDPDTRAVGEIGFAPVGRALIMGKHKGLLRVYGDKQSGRILGAEMVGPRCEHLAHLICWSIEQQLTAGELLRMPFYHPVIEEALQAALYSLYRKVDTKNTGGLVELESLPA
jgi:dihydrolipoamide dehydrogenase